MKGDLRSGNPKVGKGKGSFSFVKKGAGQAETSNGKSGKLKACDLKKEKKRRLLISDSESEEFGSSFPKSEQNENGSVDLKKKSLGVENEGRKSRMEAIRYSEDPEIDDKRRIRELVAERSRNAEIGRRKTKMQAVIEEGTGEDLYPIEHREDGDFNRNEILVAGMKRKRSGIDVFEYTDFDEVDTENRKMELWKSREENSDDKRVIWGLGSKLMTTGSRQREDESNCSLSGMVNERPPSDFHRDRSSVIKSKASNQFDRKRLRLEEDENFHSSGLPQEKFTARHGEPMRFQGKGGVLKLIPSSKMKVGGLGNVDGGRETEENGRGPGIDCVEHHDVLDGASFSRGRKYGSSESSARTDKNQMDLRKSLSIEKIKASNRQKESRSMSLQMQTKSMDVCSPKTGVRSRGESCLASASPLPTEDKDMGRKRKSRTEKQQLRDRIRSMLISAGWRIESRPRRNRNYQDAVYVNPGGTAYWSIVNAYNALQKQQEEENKADDCLSDNSEEEQLPGASVSSDHRLNGTSSPFPVIPKDDLSILTRRTLKKVKQEKSRKLQDERGSKKTKDVGKTKFLKNRHVEQSVGSLKKKEKLKSYSATGIRVSKAKMKGTGSTHSKTNGVLRISKSARVSEKARCFNGELLLSEQGSSTGTMLKGMPKPLKTPKLSFTSVNLLQGGKMKNQRGLGLLVRSSDKGASLDTDDFKPYAGKRTVLSWLIDSGTVPENGKVLYMNKRHTRGVLQGWIRRDGIHCSCCSKILTVSKFEIHAGSKMHQPFQNIFVENGVSLLQCQLDAWNKQEESERSGFHFINVDGDDPNDDTCGICGDGGDLICCDGCPSTFHQSCLNVEMLPPGDWHCPNCSCRFCGLASYYTSPDDGVSDNPLLSCNQCGEKYHQQCACKTNFVPLGSCTSFCGKNCKKLLERLEKLLGVKHDLEEGFSWTLVKRFDQNSRTSACVGARRADCNSKLAVALAVMDECFLPIIDRRSGINMIRNVLYNCRSNFNRLDYSGFYTILLERGDEIISAASIRIHGTRLAEMPFIGTRNIYRRQGMARRLLNAVESVLRSLKVEKLIIPAISELMHTWTVVFGFKPLEESLRDELRSMNMLMFPGTDLLHKQLLECECIEGNTASNRVTKAIELKGTHLVMPKVENASLATSLVPGSHTSEEDKLDDTNEMKREVGGENPGLHSRDGSSDNVLEVPKPLDASLGSNVQTSAEDSVCYNSESVYKVPDSSADMSFLLNADHQEKPELENQCPVASAIERGLEISEEGSVHDTHEGTIEVGTGVPNLHAFAGTAINCTSEVNSDSSGAISGSNFQASDWGTVHHNFECMDESLESGFDSLFPLVPNTTHCDMPEIANNPLAASPDPILPVSGEGSVSESYVVAAKGSTDRPNAYAFENGSIFCTSEFAIQSMESSEYSFRAFGESIVNHDSKSVNQSVATAPKNNGQASGQDAVLRIPELVPKYLDCDSDVRLLLSSEASHHNKQVFAEKLVMNDAANLHSSIDSTMPAPLKVSNEITPLESNTDLRMDSVPYISKAVSVSLNVAPLPPP